MANSEGKGFASAHINCEKPIYRKFLETIENTLLKMKKKRYGKIQVWNHIIY